MVNQIEMLKLLYICSLFSPCLPLSIISVAASPMQSSWKLSNRNFVPGRQEKDKLILAKEPVQVTLHLPP